MSRTVEEEAKVFTQAVGGAAYEKMLVDAGYSKQEIRDFVTFLVQEENRLYEFMGGRELVESISANWRGAMIAVSAYRLAAADQGVFNPVEAGRSDAKPFYEAGPESF